MTLTALLSDLYRRMRYQSTPATDVTTRLTAFLNETQQELAEDPRLASLLRGETTFATVVSQAEYGLPPNLGRITTIRDTGNRWKLRPESLNWYRGAWPDQTQSGTPDRYVLLGPKPVKLQPAAATGVWAASSSASDTVPTVSVEAVRTGGYPHQPTAVALTGTSRVAIGAQTDYIEITDFYLSAVCVGDVTLYDAAAAGNVLGVIPKGQTRSTYEWIAFCPTPSAIRTYGLDYERFASDLVNGTDEPYWVPAKFHRLLGAGARKKEYEYQGDERLALASQEFDRGVQMLVSHVNNPPDYVLVPGRGRGGRSDLGSAYPAGTVWD
jgi:hypothetical protein